MLYHKNLGFPTTLHLEDEYIITPKYSQHSLKSSKDDRYGEIGLPILIKANKESIIEVETADNITADKILIRIPYSSKYDICIVILLETSVIKTVWLNSVDDKHQTLVKNKYDKIR